MTITAHKMEPTDAGNSAAALNFDVLVSTNVGLPLMNWTNLVTRLIAESKAAG
ncbi:MAG TPA: hypothetical protein VMJ12_05770 [Candidatus Acidoferrales bacterium]|nr:hypothetical protein [Candidatus Acidoferrales bacterium]